MARKLAAIGVLKMKTYWFVSRHEPTQQQRALVNGQLIKVDDINSFNKEAVEDLLVKADVDDIDGIIVVNAALALNIAAQAIEREQFMPIGIFENAKRAPEGKLPTFEAHAIHWWFVEYINDWTLTTV